MSIYLKIEQLNEENYCVRRGCLGWSLHTLPAGMLCITTLKNRTFQDIMQGLRQFEMHPDLGVYFKLSCLFLKANGANMKARSVLCVFIFAPFAFNFLLFDNFKCSPFFRDIFFYLKVA
jgi:hypothetical protein